MTKLLKRASSYLPERVQQELKRLHFGQQIRRGTFQTDEPEYAKLDQWVKPGDWVLDVGANVGHYTRRMSELVGPYGRVFAFEPVPRTFEILAANVAECPNVTLLNVAVSDVTGTTGMSVPSFDTGLQNYYQANIDELCPTVLVLALNIDSLRFPQRVGLVKVDVEGHELEALTGMHDLLMRDHPVLIVEGRNEAVLKYLSKLGYKHTDIAESPNRMFKF